jgi:site-specific DNA recombinase
MRWFLGKYLSLNAYLETLLKKNLNAMPRKRTQLKNTQSCKAGETFALIYCRVSSEKQKYEGHGLDGQEQRCIDFAVSKDFSVSPDLVFKDAFTGGGDFMLRPAMRELIAYIDANPHKKFVVIFDDLKRFARDTVNHLKLRRALNNRDVAVMCPNFTFEDTPEGEFIETILAAQGQLERQQNGRQVIQKQTARARLGFWPFRAPKGYKMVKDPADGKVLVADEEYAPHLRHVLEGFASGLFPRAIDCCRYLVEQGYWSKQSPEKYIDKLKTDILMNSVYAGFVEHEGWGVARTKGRHQGLISEDTFERIQKRLRSESLGKRVRTDVSETFHLRGLVICSHCNRTMTGAISRGRSSSYPYYFCQNKDCAEHRENIRAEKLHADFKVVMQKQHLKDDVDKVINEIFDEVWKEEVSLVAASNKSLEDELNALRSKLSQYTDLLFDTSISREMKNYYRDESQRLTEVYQDLKQNTYRIADTNIPYRTALEKTTKLLKSPYDIWVSLDAREKQEVFFFVFDEKLAYSKKAGYRTDNLPSAIRLFEEFVTTNSHDVEMGGIEPPSE